MAEHEHTPSALQPGNGYRLPPEAYYDAAWFQREQRELFPATWNFVCSTADVATPGSYFTSQIGHYPIAVVRDKNNSLRAFHNVCRHRGARILDDAGECSRITCPYHRWQYGLDGRLENVPQSEAQIPLLAKEDWALKTANLAQWMGLVFVNPDGTAPAFNSWLGPINERLRRYDLEGLAELAREEYTFDANWKFYIENHIDWYHLWYTHSRTLSMLDHHAGYWEQSGAHWLSFEPFKESDRADSFRPIEQLNDELRFNGAHLLFPNLPLFGGAGWFGTGHLMPLAADKTRMSFRLWALPDQDATEFLSGFHEVTQVEDAEMAARMQATVQSPAFQVGPLTEQHEAPITHFHDHYLKFFD
jgi:phenylpropionate dioxygenase-like ring-hydroxylating dioxygenase large terminal subunit